MNDSLASKAGEKLKAGGRQVRSRFRGAVRGALWGATIAVLLLAVFAIMMMVKAGFSAPSSDNVSDTALGMTTFLGGFVCFGPLFIAICTFLGAATGLVRARKLGNW